jgi:hypothetical protein
MRRALAVGSLLVVTACSQAAAVPSASQPTTGATRIPTSGLLQLLASLPLPPGTVRVKAPASIDPNDVVGEAPPATRAAAASWTSPLPWKATMAWLANHLPPTWTHGSIAYSGSNETYETFTSPANVAYDGPSITVYVDDATSGSKVRVNAWEIPLKPKSADETVTGVTSVTAHMTNDNHSDIKPYTVQITGAKAQRLAADLNALVVDPDLVSTGLAGNAAATLVFHTATGDRTFLAQRNAQQVDPEPQRSGDPDLLMSQAMFAELDADLGHGVSTILPPPPHPVLPSDVTSVTVSASWPDSHGKKPARTVTVTGRAARRLARDVSQLDIKPNAGVCRVHGKANVSLTFEGNGRTVHADAYGDCQELSSEPPVTTSQDQQVDPFDLSPAVAADLAADLR